MFSYGTTSSRRRDECHPYIVLVLNRMILERNISVLCGIRDKDEQQEAFDNKKSQVLWPDSDHNIDPDNPKNEEYPDKSIAVDIGVYHPELEGYIAWKNKDEFWETWKVFERIVAELKSEGAIPYDQEFISGCDWDGDGIRVDEDPDEHFFDGPHIGMVV